MRFSKTVAISLITLVALVGTAATKSASKEMKAGPNRAYVEKVWAGWSTLNPDNVSEYYASGPHTFFDIAPLKYSSWDEYKAGVRKELVDYKSAKFTVNDDLDLHPSGNYIWGTATIKFEMTHQNGKVDMGSMRWTVVFEKQGGKWLIVHEHVSMPIA
jgi:ketosteroid isomerase-like protein